MKKDTATTLRAFLIELAVYAVLVVGYFFLVLHFLGGWLHQLEMHHRYTYAGVAILLIIGQAVVLENVTSLLLRIIRGRTE
jgi:NADH:ubiquinone oxidoreductase subunit H